eukprot:5509370-Lingulodinium_polyedra.AAC.1
MEGLASCGLLCHLEPSLAKSLKPEHPLVVEQDQLASQLLAVQLQILAVRGASMAWHREGYPGRLALLLSDSPDELA